MMIKSLTRNLRKEEEEEQAEVDIDDLATKCTPEHVAKYLRGLKIKEEIVMNFLDERVGGTWLLYIIREKGNELEELGVTSGLQRSKINSHFELFLKEHFK